MSENIALPKRGSGRSAERKRRRNAWRFARDLVIILLIAVLVSFLVKTFLVRSFYIPSGSMQHTLQKNDRILVNELIPAFGDIERGDIVVFKDPGGWLPKPDSKPSNPVAESFDWALSMVGISLSDSEEHLVKRVIGLPGDHVVCCNAVGQLSVNGSPISEPYITIPYNETAASRDSFDVVVPEDSLWVMGDNRYNSADSRYNRDTPGHGFVPISDVVGKAFLITWPLNRITVLDDHHDSFSGVPDGQR